MSGSTKSAGVTEPGASCSAAVSRSRWASRTDRARARTSSSPGVGTSGSDSEADGAVATGAPASAARSTVVARPVRTRPSTVPSRVRTSCGAGAHRAGGASNVVPPPCSARSTRAAVASCSPSGPDVPATAVPCWSRTGGPPPSARASSGSDGTARTGLPGDPLRRAGVPAGVGSAVVSPSSSTTTARVPPEPRSESARPSRRPPAGHVVPATGATPRISPTRRSALERA